MFVKIKLMKIMKKLTKYLSFKKMNINIQTDGKHQMITFYEGEKLADIENEFLFSSSKYLMNIIFEYTICFHTIKIHQRAFSYPITVLCNEKTKNF